MASVYQLKPAFQNLLRPLVKSLAKNGISANQITVGTCMLSIAVATIYYFNPVSHQLYLLFPIYMIIRMALNAVDGMLAREHNMQSKLGGILNELTDVISDTALFIPFMFTLNISSLNFIIFVSLSIISEMTGVVSVQVGSSRAYNGPMGKSNRAFFFGMLAFLIGFNVNLGSVIEYIFVGLEILLVLTIVNRANAALVEA